jgi:CheY-like chemotaxis protein
MLSATILVFEDDQALLEAITHKLKLSSFTVLSARTVEDGLQYLEQGQKVDAIWLDHYLLGEETGLDLVRQLKENAEWKNIPIFVVSNTASPDKVQAYMKLGVERYYTKVEYKLDEIISNIENYLEQKM